MWKESDFSPLKDFGVIILPEETKKNGITPNTIVGYDNEKKILESFFSTIKSYLKMDSTKKPKLIKPSLTALLHGLPGTGKTTLVKAFASKYDLPIFLVFADSLIASHLGESFQRLNIVLNDIQRMSKEKGPLILFFDELDAIASERSNDQEVGEIKRLVITFLQRIDDMVISAPGVVLIGATNHAESLDRAVWRRFSFHIKFDLPPKEAKFELIDRMLDDLEFNASLKMELGIRNYKNREDVTDIIENYTGADIQRAFQVIYLDALKEIQINPGYEIGKLKMIEIISLVGGTSRIQDEIKLNNKNTTNEQNRSEIQRKFKLNKQ